MEHTPKKAPNHRLDPHRRLVASLGRPEARYKNANTRDRLSYMKNPVKIIHAFKHFEPSRIKVEKLFSWAIAIKDTLSKHRTLFVA